MDCERIREQLEAYTLDVLDPDVRADVERHLPTCASCREEAAALAETVALFPAALALVSPMTPPNDIRDRVLQAVSHVQASNSSTTLEREPAGRPATPPVERHWSAGPIRLFAYAIPVFLLVFSLAWGIRLTVALDRERDLKIEYADLIDDVVGQQELVFEVIGFDDTNRQFLAAQQEDSTSYGKLFTRPGMPFVVVMAGRLPLAPPGDTFNVWVTSNGKTTLAGELTVDEAGFGLLVFTVDQPGPVYESALVTLQSPGSASPNGIEILRHEDGEAS